MEHNNIYQIPRKVGLDMAFIDNIKGDESLEIKDDFIIDREFRAEFVFTTRERAESKLK